LPPGLFAESKTVAHPLPLGRWLTEQRTPTTPPRQISNRPGNTQNLRNARGGREQRGDNGGDAAAAAAASCDLISAAVGGGGRTEAAIGEHAGVDRSG